VKGAFEAAAVLVSGALFGSFLGKVVVMALPNGRMRDLFATEKIAGLSPTHLDLSLVDFTFGCVFRLNIMSAVGIVAAAVLFKKVLK
jgi:hypothetical protein